MLFSQSTIKSCILGSLIKYLCRYLEFLISCLKNITSHYWKCANHRENWSCKRYLVLHRVSGVKACLVNFDWSKQIKLISLASIIVHLIPRLSRILYTAEVYHINESVQYNVLPVCASLTVYREFSHCCAAFWCSSPASQMTTRKTRELIM